MGLHKLSENTLVVRDIADFESTWGGAAAFAALFLLLAFLLGVWPALFLAALAFWAQVFRKKTSLLLHRHTHSMEVRHSSLLSSATETISLHHVKKLMLLHYPFIPFCSVRIVFADGREMDPHITLQVREGKEAASFMRVQAEIEAFLFAE